MFYDSYYFNELEILGALMLLRVSNISIAFKVAENKF
jgi:hypothetical protein